MSRALQINSSPQGWMARNTKPVSLAEKGWVITMKKISIILLSAVLVFSMAACNGGKEKADNQTEKQMESVKPTEEVAMATEAVTEVTTEAGSEETEKDIAEVKDSEEKTDKEDNQSADNETASKQKEKSEQDDEPEQKAPASGNKEAGGNQSNAGNGGQTTDSPKDNVSNPQPASVAYSPQNVVSLATAKCQAGGMITTQQNLQNHLNDGSITQEEYNEYYPYDGMEGSYYSVFVETDLNKASTIDGQRLSSEDAIAEYIASLTFSDDRQKLDMSVTKLDAEDNTPIAGAVFGLYADEDIKNVDGRVIIEKGTLLEKATSDENGKIAFVKDYPFAKYVARELVKPAGYVTNEEAVNFDTKYQGQDVKTAVYNSEYINTPTTFEFTKTDITSGAELTGATLTVLDKDGNVVDTWTSDAKEAHVIKKLVVGETYTLREEFAPYGYLKATDIQFTVEDTGDVQHVEMKDEVPTGSIVINKDGEFVTDTTLMKGHWYDFIFNYFKDSLAGVTFDVYAKEDIVSADGLGTVYHKAGDKVATIVTNDKGIARIDDLPLGKYYLVETKTLDGFVLDDTPIDADLSYIDQNTKVVFAGMDVTNERQKVQITVTKTDSETKNALEGAVFGLFAKEDIVNKDGKVIVKADTQIERGVTGKDGKVTFTSDLPLGQYYVKEIEAPKGYVKSDKTFDVDASYQGDKVKVIEFEAAFENALIKVEISKTDITGKKELPGAKLSVIDADGKLVESWTSEAGKTHMIERLPVGKYTLREESAPYGYKVASDVTFEVKETAEIQKVSMKDEQAVGKIVIEKTDKVTGKPIEGVVFEVRDKDGKVLDTLTTDKNGHAESKELPICTYNEDGSFKEDIHYTVVETKAADGYILDETAHDVTLRYDDNAPDVVVATLKLANVPTEPKLPQTGDNANPLLYLGIGALALITGVGVGLRGRKKKNKQ